VDSENDRYAGAQTTLGMVGSARRAVSPGESVAANIAWWDADAADYLAEHGATLGESDFLWCPEGLQERDIELLGEVAGKDVLEVGCGSAPCARWLVTQGARVAAVDLSAGMLRHAAQTNSVTGITPSLVRANAEQLPFATASFDIACSAFGAVPFVADVRTVFAEVARVLRPGGQWVFAVTHPIRWIFPDDPGPAGLTVITSYFDRTPYLEVDADGRATYVEHHRTMGDYVRALRRSGFILEDLIEPEWPEGRTTEWGQWSPLRGELFPGTAIFCCRRAE
jgi:SAM-dependent methyltransferase